MPRQLKCSCGSCQTCKRRDYMRAYYHSTPKRRTTMLRRAKANYRRRRRDPEWYERHLDARRVVNMDPAARSARRRSALAFKRRQRIGQIARPGLPDPKVVKRAAHLAVQRALKSGRLVKPESCNRCPRTGLLHGHHRDYSKPLVVEWLCPKCHGAEHRKWVAA